MFLQLHFLIKCKITIVIIFWLYIVNLSFSVSLRLFSGVYKGKYIKNKYLLLAINLFLGCVVPTPIYNGLPTTGELNPSGKFKPCALNSFWNVAVGEQGSLIVSYSGVYVLKQDWFILTGWFLLV